MTEPWTAEVAFRRDYMEETGRGEGGGNRQEGHRWSYLDEGHQGISARVSDQRWSVLQIYRFSRTGDFIAFCLSLLRLSCLIVAVTI